MAIKEICCLVWTTLMLATVICSPTSRPIEHSPSDLAWDDWLQQRSRQAAPPRRITTKSLFVFPNLGTESLPACADGYRPDSMGRCVKVVKVDENAHLQFLLDKLNSQFATDSSGQDEVYDYEGVDGDTPEGSGPFQLSIPIAQHQIKGPESDEIEGSGDGIVLHKKEMSEKPTNPPPTSSPEIVPEYVNSESIYLDNAALTSNLQVNNIPRNDTNSLSIFPSNKTDSGLTVFVSSNGKYGNVTAQTQIMKNETDLVGQLEHIKKNTTDEESTEPTTVKNTNEKIDSPLTADNIDKKINLTSSTVNQLDTTQEITTKSNDEIKNDDELEQPSVSSGSYMDDVLENTESEIKIAEMLVEQIEALKQQVANKLLEFKQKNNEVHHKTSKHPDKPLITLDQKPIEKTDIITSTTKPLNLNDIEEKIKRISLFADVTTNAESRYKLEALNIQKHSQENNEDFVTNQKPNANFAHYFTQSYPVSNIHRTPTPISDSFSNRNGIYGVVQEERPYWWPSNGWAIDNQPNEENFRDYWSRGPTTSGNPFGVRYEGEHHPAPHPLLYPSIRERDRISVRHTSTNHRRGREGRHRKRQIQSNGNQYYLNKSPDIVNMLQTYDGR